MPSEVEKAAAKAQISSLAEKQYANALKSVGTLQDVGFHKFKSQLKLVAHSDGWHPSVLDETKAVPAPSSRTDKYKADVNNAYKLIRVKTDGHAVENILESGDMGDARAAWLAVQRHFVRPTAGGKSAASKKFHNSSMETTNSDLLEWGSTVHRNANDLKSVGGLADEDAMITCFLDGLLPEFEPIKDIIESAASVGTLAEVQAKVEDYAAKKSLTDLRKSSKNAKHRTFMAVGKTTTPPSGINPDEPCRMYSLGKCRWGNKCYRSHKGPGGCLPGAPGEKKVPSCNFCQEPGHILKECALYAANPPAVNMVVGGDAQAATSPATFITSAKDGQSPFVPVPGRMPTVMHIGGTYPSRPTKPPAASAFMMEAHPETEEFTVHPQQLPIADAPEKVKAQAQEACVAAYASLEGPRANNHTLGGGILAVLMLLYAIMSLPAKAQSYLQASLIVIAAVMVGTALVCQAIGWVPTSLFSSRHSTDGPHEELSVENDKRAQKVSPPKSTNTIFTTRKVTTRMLLVCIFGLIMTGFVAFAVADAGPTALDTAYVQATSYLNEDGSISVPDQYEWCCDTGTNRFVTNDVRDFVPGSIRRSPINVAVGGGVVISPCSGTVRIKSINHNHVIECEDVLFLPECAKKLVPAYQFLNKGCSLSLSDNYVCLHKDKTLILSGKEFGGLYYYHSQTERYQSNISHVLGDEPDTVDPSYRSSALFGLPVGKHISAKSADFSQKLLEAHWAYGHLNFKKLRKMFGLSAKGDDPHCPACTIAKQKQKALADHAHTRASRINYLMWIDIGFTAGSRFKFQLYVDDFTRESFIDVLKSKDQCLPRWKDLQAHLENEHFPYKFARVKTDSEPIYWTPAWEEYCSSHGLIHDFSSAYKHGQLGVVERAMATVGVPFRCTMLTGNAPEKLIPYALRFANVIRNHSPTKANNGWSPIEKRLGRKIPINSRLLKGPLFCLVFAQIYADERIKHGRRGVACVYLGYDPVNNTYIVMEWETQAIYYCADVEFYPNVFPFRSDPKRTVGTLNRFDDLAPNITDQMERGDVEEQRLSIRQRGYRLSGGKDIADIPDKDVAPDSNFTHSGTFFVHPYGPDPENMDEALLMADADDWVMAELAEKESWKAHDAYEIVLRTQATSRGKRIFKNKPVLKRKFNPPDDDFPFGSLDKHKYRLTIAAYTKTLTEGIDYKEKHAGTVRWNAIKVILAIAVKEDYDIILLDIKTFFLYGKFTVEEVYMELPERWAENDESPPEYIMRLKSSVYGWPAAPNLAQYELNQQLISEKEMKPTRADDCVFVSTDKSTGYVACGTHVDDILTAGDPAGLKKVRACLEKKFKITVKENPTHVTGVQIQRNREKKWAKLHQCDYVTKLLEKEHMLNSTPVDTPMDPGTAKVLMQLPQDAATPESTREYLSILGALMWLYCRCRPDLMFCVNLFSRFSRCASPDHLKVIRGRPLRYLNGTRDYGIVFMAGEDDEWKLSGSSDADLAGDLNSAKSTLSVITKLGMCGNISSSTNLERKICTSTGQAETYAFVRLIKEVLWVRLLLNDLGYEQEGPTPCETDNDGVIIQSTKLVNHAAAKHYRISQAFIRQIVLDSLVEPVPVNTNDNPADMGTKALHAPAFHRHRAAVMGPQDRPT